MVNAQPSSRRHSRARQVGKTTLARQIVRRFDGPATHFDLEDPDDLARLGLEQIDVIHAGEHTYLLTAGVRAVAFRSLPQDVEPL
jgi:hypothetical protein